MKSRRHFLKSVSAGVAGATLAEVSAAPEEKTEAANRRLRVGLAAYSFQMFLPNYRKNDTPGETKMDMAGFIDYSASLDTDAVELTSYFLPDPCPRALAFELKRKAHQHGLDISGGAIGNNFSYDPAGEELAKQMAYTERWLATYAELGAPVIRVFAGHPKSKDLSPEQAEKNIVKNLQNACEIAGKYGVILGVENHDFTTDIDRMKRILEAVDSPWFGLNFDSGNLAKTSDPYGDLKRIAPHTVNAQLKVDIPRDGKKEPADFKRIVDILGEAGYSGTVVLEYENKKPYEEVPMYLEKLREAIG
ncbi:sugar phosphate isomerase/epimerase [Verrucomicrobiales bacterium]|nr:sugar phosphate isomerase/epimerase [Verrucomicrobiales bacterium]